jgi:poly-gamma-glutamate capsule biosynthesis protein CapA/YwtB (metallophosphatase superfamily)
MRERRDIPNFDKKGFLFFIKFTFFVLVLIVSTHYGSDVFVDNAFPVKIFNTASADTQLAVVMQRRQEKRRQFEEVDTENIFTLGFVGDIMLDRAIEKVIVKNGNGDYSFPFEFVKDKLNKYDILFGNLEGPISNKGKDLGSIFSFRMDTKTTDALTGAGFDILSVANNHAGDWGKEAMTDTYSWLDKAKIKYSGGGLSEEQAYAPKILELGGLKIAYISFSEFGSGYLEATPDNPGIAIISDEKLRESINIAKKESDIIIVSFHYGDEYKSEPNLYQKTVSKKAIDYGADLVVGHHPHVPEPVVKYKNGYIAYSLGNFIFDQNLPEDGSDIGLILEATIKDGKISEVNPVKIKFNHLFQPFVAN